MILIIVCVSLVAAVSGNVSTSSRTQQSEIKARVYTYESELRTNIAKGSNWSAGSEITIGVSGKFSVSTLYQRKTERSCSLLLIQMETLKFSTLPEANEDYFIKKERLELDLIESGPFLLQLCANRLENILLNPKENVAIKNLKKAVAALFQFQFTPMKIEETDICGTCQVTYRKVHTSSISKEKESCEVHPPIEKTHKWKEIFPLLEASKRRVVYLLDENDPSLIIKATAHDNINFSSGLRDDMRSSISSSLNVVLTGFVNSTIADVGFVQSLDEAVQKVIDKFKITLEEDTLHLTLETVEAVHSSLQETIEMNREFLLENKLGTSASAAAFVRILKIVQQSTKEDIIQVLEDKHNGPVLNQLMDILGGAQTAFIHEAILEVYNFGKIQSADFIERYLWAISVTEQPNLQSFKDFIRLYDEKFENEKLKETVLLTIAAIADKLSEKFKEEVFKMIVNHIRECPKQEDVCVAVYLRALKNMKYAGAIPVLLHYSLTGSRAVSVTALKVIHNLPRHLWNEQVLKVAEKILYQKDRIYDSSARSIAVDILVDAGLNREKLHYLALSLRSIASYEIRRYLLQRLQQEASVNETTDKILRSIMKQQNLFNYDFLAQKGLSNAIKRPILQSENLNASFISINQVTKNVLRRSHVSLILEQNEEDALELLKLDLYANGLSSFLWSDDAVDDEELDEPEEVTAGIEITLCGVQMRPFIFFHGHTELMGHIWAGTASNKTPIVQILRSFPWTNRVFPLSAGYIISMDLMGAISFELAGRITFSIWNRNAHSLSEARVGTSIVSLFFIKTFLAEIKLYSELAVDSQLEMTSNLDFYDEVLFCLQISQTRSIFNSSLGMERTVQDEKHSHQENFQYVVPGRTLLLNRRNNEMCNSILQNNIKV